MVSELYQLIGYATSRAKPTYIRTWERDLGLDFTPDQLTYLYQLTCSSAIDSTTQETNYKILSRWYCIHADNFIPLLLTSDGGTVGHRGTLLHLWWDCPVIRPFWLDISTQIRDIMGLDVPLSLIHFLFHIPPMPVRQYKKSTILHLLNAAKSLLSIYWKQSQIPSREKWLSKVSEIKEAEDWIAT